MTSGKLSDKRTLIGAAVLIITRIVLVVALTQLFVSLIPSWTMPALRIVIALLVSGLGLYALTVIFRDSSLIWQLALQSVAFAGVGVGVGFLLKVLFTDWRLLPTLFGARGLVVLLTGVCSALLMRYTQASRRRKRA
jgi:hypothetical protein